jgi:hypothetical protein
MSTASVAAVGSFMFTGFHAILFAFQVWLSTGGPLSEKELEEKAKNPWSKYEKPLLNASPVLMAFQAFTFVYCIFQPSWLTVLVQLIVAMSYWYALYST